MQHIAVILSGSGYLDGAEIREAVLSLLYLDQQGANVSLFAPDMPQAHVVNHMNGDESREERNILTESARIARGDIQPLTALDTNQFDGLVMPGGFGVAKQLCDFAFKGGAFTVQEDVAAIIKHFHHDGKPIGAMCIAPVLVAKALEGKQLTMTIGEDADTAAVIEQLGHTHQTAASEVAVVDSANKIVTCSAYMREDRIAPIAQGIEQLVQAVLNIIENNRERKAS